MEAGARNPVRSDSDLAETDRLLKPRKAEKTAGNGGSRGRGTGGDAGAGV